MKQHLLLALLCITSLCIACSSPDIPLPPEEEPGTEQPANPDAIHDKIREKPYPKMDNELFINPAPLIVPQAMKTADCLLQFELSDKSTFDGPTTFRSTALPWNMFNLHQSLNTGTWYWRFRSVTQAGKEEKWSDTYSFEVKAETPTFVTPPFDRFAKQLPVTHPRLYCFLDNKIKEARRKVTSHREYKALIYRASTALNADYSTVNNPYDKATEIKQYTDFLYQAYHLTQDPAYTAKSLQLLRLLLSYPVTDKQLFATNFGSTDIATCFLHVYDIAYAQLTGTERTACEEMLMRIARFYYKMYCGAQENNIFDNHFWQHNLRVLFQCAFVLHDKAPYTTEALQMLEYYYELWTARAPDSGFNRDGIWRNGVNYFTANIRTLYYMPSLFSYLTKSDFLQHPWYRHAGRAMVYSWLPDSRSNGFGDGNEKASEPDRQRIAFADFLARETGDAYAGWYATQCAKVLTEDIEMRLYRMASEQTYASNLPEDSPKYIWHRDAGEVAMHSDLTHPSRNLALSFRSSTFASGSHTLADQNSFQLLYKGADVYRSSGYYLNFSDAHNLTSYRHTRAHNSILVNGIGQPFSMKGYGNVTRALGGEHITYCLGDASNAYADSSDDPMWIDAFKAAGITQTPADGFGKTPLTLYRRHVLMLHPDVVVIYDELEAAEPVRWDWLLHSPTPFTINQTQFTTTHAGQGFTSVAQLFSQQSCRVTQTDKFVVPPDPKLALPAEKYPNQWHLTATFDKCAKNRILTIIQILPTGGTRTRTLPVGSEATSRSSNESPQGEKFQCGNWLIRATLNPEQPAGLTVTNEVANAIFSYGTEHPVINGKSITRQYRGSSLLYDRIEGESKHMEMLDYKPISPRAIGVSK